MHRLAIFLVVVQKRALAVPRREEEDNWRHKSPKRNRMMSDSGAQAPDSVQMSGPSWKHP